MGECTSKEWGRGKKKIVKKKLTRAEVEALIPGRHGMTASEAAGATDVIMAAMEDVSTSWEVHDDGDDDDKDDHHAEQFKATKAEQVKQRDTQHNLEEVVENAPSSSVGNAQLDKEKHDHPITAASSSQHSESLIESFEYVQHSDACLSNNEIEIKPHTLLSEYLAAQQTFEKLSTNAPQAPEHTDKDIIAMIHSTGLLESVNKRIQDLLQLQLQSDTQVFKEQDMSEAERDQMKDSLTIGGSTQQMSESYIVNLQKALQLIRLKVATETEHEIGPEDSFAPETVNSSECCGTSKICTMQETEDTDTISNLKQKFLTEARLVSLENLTVARNSELQEKLVNANILHQEQIKEVESMSNPRESDSHSDAKPENSLSIEEKDISPITTEGTFNKETTTITSSKTNDRKINQNMEYLPHLEHSQETVQPEIPEAYETSPGHKIREVQVQEHTQTMTDSGVVQHANVQAEPQVSYRPDIILSKDLTQDGAVSHLDLKCQEQKDVDKSNRVAEDIINPTQTLELHQIDSVLGKELVDKTALTQVGFSHEQDTNIKTLVEQISQDPNGKDNAKLTKILEGIDATTGQECGAKIDSTSPFTEQIETTYIKRPIETDNGNKTTEEAREVTIHKTDFPVLTDQEETIRSPTETAVQVIQPTGVDSTSGINKTDMGNKTENLISNLEFQIAEHMLISQEGKDKEINQIKYINKDDGDLKQALKFEIAASQNVDTPENANKLSSNEKQSFHVPEVNEPMPAQEENAACIQNSISISQDQVIVSDDLTSDEIDKIDQASVTENFEYPNEKLNCETDIDSVEEVLQTMKVATDNELQEINESTTQPMQHGESTVNENSSVCDMITITDGATTVECRDGEEITESSPRFELPIHTDKEDGYVEKKIGGTEECQVQQEKLYEDNILERTKLEPAASSEKVLETSDHCISQELTDAIKVVQTRPEEEESIKSHIQEEDDQSEHSTSDEIQNDSTKEMFPPATGNESQGRSGGVTYMVQDNEPIGTEYLANHHDATAITHNAEAAESTSGHKESERSSFLEQQMIHDKVLEQASQLLPPDLAQPFEIVHKASLDEEIYGQVPSAQKISEIVPPEGTQHQEESTVVVNVAAGREMETAKTPESPRDLSLSFDKEETPSLHETNKFNLLVPITEVEVSKAVSAFDTGAIADEDNSLLLETRNDDLPGTNTAHSLVQQEEATLNVKMSSMEESVVVANVAAGSEKETAKTPETPRDLKFYFDKEEDCSMHETNKTSLLVPITEVEVSHAVSAFDTVAITEKDSSPLIDAGSIDLLKIFDNSLSPVQHTEATLHEQMSSLEDPTATTYVAAGIEKKTVSETPESTKDVLPSLEKEGSSSSHENDKSNLVIPIPQVQELEADSAFDTDAVTNEESICLSVTETENNDLQDMTNNAPALVQQCEATLNKQMSSAEDSVIVTNVVTGIEKEIASKIPESTRGLNSSFEKEDASSSYTTDESNLMVQILEVKTSEEASAFDMGAMTKNNGPPVIELGNDDIVRMNNAGTSLFQQAEAILHVQMSSGDDSVAANHGSAVLVPEVEESEAVSTFNPDAITGDSYPAIDKRNNDLEIPITVPVLIRQTEATQHEQMSCTKDSLAVTHAVTGIVKESADKTTESSRDLKLSFDEEETSSSLETDKYNLTIPIPEVEASEAISAFETDAMTDKDSSLVIERGYNDLQGANETVPTLVQQVEATLHEKMLSIEDAVIMNHFAAGIGEVTKSDTPKQATDLKLSFNEEEAASSNETGKSNLMVQIQDAEASGATSVFYASAITEKNNSPVIESGNYDLQGITNTTTVLAQQAELASLQKMSFEEEAIVVTHVSARIEKEISGDTLESTRGLQLPLEEEDTSSSHETDEFELLSLPEDMTPGAVSTFDIGEGADKDSSPVMETGNNKLLLMTNTVDDLVVQAEAVQNEQKSPIDDSAVVTQVASGIEKETASKTLESIGDLQISFEEKETSNSYDIDTSHLPVPIPQLAEFTVPAFDTGAMADEKNSPIIETRNDDSQGLTDDLLVLTNNTSCPDHHAEAILHQKMSSTEDLVVQTNVSAGMEKETASETPESTRDLQLSFKEEESLCEIDKSNLRITITEVEASEAASDFDKVAITDKNIFPVIESENKDLLGMIHTKTGPVQQDGDTLLEQMSYAEDSKVVTQVSAGIVKETSSETLQLTKDLQLPIEEKEASSLHESDKLSQMFKIPEAEEEDASSSYKTDKSEFMVPIPEDTSEAISTFGIGSEADTNGSPTMETDSDKLQRVTNSVPALVAQAEATLNEENSAIDNLIVGTQVTTGVEEGTANEIAQSTGDLQLPFQAEETSNLYDIDKSNLTVPIPEVEATEVVSAFDTGDVTHEKSSPAAETSSDHSSDLTNDLLVLTNIEPGLVQQTEATLHEQISSTEVPVVETQDPAANEKETVREISESTGDLQPSFGEKECLCEIDKFNITVPFSEIEESEAASAFETDVMTDGIIIPVIQSENNDLLRVTNTETALVQQDGATLIEQMSCLEDSMVVTQVSAGIGKETSSETLESTNYSAEEKESSSQIDKSNITVPFSEVEESEADQASDIDAVTAKIITPVIQSENNNLLGMTNSETALVQQDGATLLEQMSYVEDSMVVPQLSAGIGKETSIDTRESTKDLQLSVEEKEAPNLHHSNKSSQMFHIPDAEEEVSSSSQEIEKSELMFLIPEDTASEAVSTFDIGAEANQEDSPAMETGNKKLVGVTNTVPALVAQAEVTINDQASSIDDSIVVTQIAAEIEEENSSETPQSMGDLQFSFEKKEASNSYDDKSNLMVSITEVEETEAVSTFDTGAMTHKESSPVTETRNDDSLGLTSDLLVLSNTQAEPTQHKQMSTIEESVVETHDATGTKKETVGETPESTRDLKLSLEQEESLCEIDKSNISVPNSKFEASEAAPAFEMIAVTDNIIIPVGESDNNNLLEMSNTETALVHQDQATILDEMSCLEDSMVATEVSARIGKETSSETLESTKDLQLSVEEKEASSFHESDKSSQTFGTPEIEEEDSLRSQETDKSKLQVLIPEDTTSEAVSAYDIGVEAYQDGSPAMETGNNKLGGVITTVPVQVAQAEVTINGQTSSKDDSIVVAQAAEIDEETASETPQSMQDLQLSFNEEADPKSFDINKSNLVVPIPVVEETEVVSAFDTVAKTHEDSSPVIETRNDDSLRLTDDLLVLSLTNTEPVLVHQAEPIQHEKISSIEESVVKTHDATENNKETMSEIPESTGDLKLSSEQEESLCKIDKSDITAPIPEVEALEAAPAFEMIAMTDNIIIPVGESQNDDLLEMSNPETALVTFGTPEIEEEDSLRSQETDKSKLQVLIPEDTTSEAVSAYDIGVEALEAAPAFEMIAMTDNIIIPVGESQNDDLLEMSNPETALVTFGTPEIEEEDSLRSQETDKSKLQVLIPEDTTSEAVSTYDIGVEAYQDGSPAMETGNNKLGGGITTVPVQVAQAEVTINGQTSSKDDSIVVAQAAEIDEETASETPQSMQDLQLSFNEEADPKSFDINKSNLVVPIPVVEETEVVSAFDTVAKTHEDSSPVIETRNDDSLRLTDDLLVLINTEPVLVHQAEPIQHEKISSIEESVVKTHDATENNKETMSEIPESTGDLKLSSEQEESLCKIDKSDITAPIPEVEALEAAPAFEMIAMTDNIIIPVGESQNDDLLEMSNPETALVTFGTPEIEEEDSLRSQETDKSKLQVLIPEDTTSEAVSAYDIGVEAYQDGSPAMETGNNKLGGVITTVPVQVAQAEVTINGQTSSKDDSIVVAQAAEIDEETASETPQSMQDLQLSFNEEADPKSFDINKSNLVVPIPVVEETEVVSAFDTVAKTHEDSSPVIETRNDDSLRLTDDILVLINTEPVLVHQAEPIQHEKISSIEESVVKTHDATENNKETMSEIPESTGDLKLSSEQEESLCKIDKSDITAPIPEVEALEAAPAFEMIAMTDNIIIPVGESQNDDLLEMSNPETALVHQDPATHLDQISCVEDSMVVTNVSAGIEKDTSSETSDSTRDLQLSFEEKEASSLYESNKSSQMVQIPEVEEEDTLSSHETDKSKLIVPIPEDTTTGARSIIDIDAGVDQEESPSTETENNKLAGAINTVPALVAQTETTTLNEQTLSIDESVVVTQVSAGIEEETASETPQSMENLQLSFAEEETSHSYHIGKFNVAVPIQEVEATEAVSAIETGDMTHEESSPVIEIRNNDTLRLTDDLLVLTNTEPALFQQGQSYIGESLVETHDATGTDKETVRETPGSTVDLQLPFKQEEMLCEIVKSNITVPIPEVDTSDANPAFEVIAVKDDIIIPVGESENNNLLEMTDPKTAPVHQDRATLLDQTSCVEDSMVVTNVSAEIGNDTSSETPDSTRDLQLSIEEKEASSLYESDKSNQMVHTPEVEAEDTLSSHETDKSELAVQIPNDTTLGSVSTIDIGAEADQDESPSMETENNNLVGVINTVPTLVAQTETTTLNEQTSSIDHSVAATQVAAGIEEETATETPQSMGNIQLPFAEEESSHSYDNSKSNAPDPILEVEAAEAVSAIDTCVMNHEKSSPVIEIKKDDTLELTDDLLVLTNTDTALIQQAEATPHEQIPLIEESVVETHDATGSEKETMRETPGSTRDLQLPFKQEERLCEIDKSEITVPIPEVEASEAASAFEMISVTNKIIIPVEESENNNLLEMSNANTAPVHQDKAALVDQISCVEDSMVVTSVSTGIEKDTSSEIPNSTRDLQISVEEKEASRLYESDKSSQTVQIPEVEEEDALSSHETDKSELIAQNPEDTILGAVSTIDIAAGTDQDDSPATENENNKLLGVIDTVPVLVAQADATLNEKTPSIDDSVVETQVVAGIEEEIVCETPQSMGNLELSFEEAETSHSYDIAKSNLEVSIPEVETTEAVSAFDTDTRTHEEVSPIIEVRNDGAPELTDDSLVLTNTETALIQQAEVTPHEQMPSIEKSWVETRDATGTEKETVSKIPGSARDLQLTFEQEESLCEIDRSNITVPLPEVLASEAAPALEMIAVKENIAIPVGESENNDLIKFSNPKTAPVHQDISTLLDQISCVEDSIVVTNASEGIGKDTSSETPDSTRDLQLPVEEKEASSLNESDKSGQMVQIPEVEEEDALSSHETDKSELIVRIPEDTTLGVVPTIDIAAGSDHKDSPVMENKNNILMGMINAVPAFVTQTEATLNEQTSSIDESVIKTQAAAEIEEETARETPQPMGNVQLPLEEEETSHSYDIGKPNLEVPIPEVEATEAVSAFATVAMIREESSPVIKIRNDATLELTDDLLVLTNTEPALIQQAEATPHEQMPSIEKSLVETHHATGTQKETVSETPGSTTDLQLPFKQEERLCEINESKITVPIPEVEALEPTSAFEMISVTDKIIIPVEESENNNLLEMSNANTAPVHQDKAALVDQISCVEDSMVVTNVSTGIEKDTSSEIPNSTRDLQISVEEKEASRLYESDKSSQTVQIPEVEEEDALSSHETDKSELIAQNPEDTILGAVSTIDIAAGTDQDDSPATENENNKLLGVIDTVPVLVAQADATLNEKTPSIDDSVVETQVVAGIEEEIVCETPQSMGNLELSFEEAETSHSYDIAKSNLEVSIPEVETTEAVSAFDTDTRTHEEVSPIIEVRNDGAPELTDDSLVLTNTETALIQQAEVTPHEQMPSIEKSWVETRGATGTEKETVSKIPGSARDLQLTFEQEESLCEIDRSNITVPLPEVLASEAAPALEMIAVKENIAIPVGESENNDLIKFSNPKTAPVHQDISTLLDQISCVEDSIVVTNASEGIGKDTSSETPDSTRDLQLPVEEKEASSLNESDKSGQMVQIPEVEEEDALSSHETDKSELIVRIPEDTTLGVVPTIDIAAGSDHKDSPVMENKNNILMGVINAVPAFVTQTEATLNEQTSSIDESVIKTQAAAEIEEETARETPQPMGNVQLPLEEEKTSHSYDIGKSNLEVPIPEVEATEAVSAFATVAMIREESSPVIKIRNDDTLELTDDLLVLTNTEPALIQQAEATPHEQMPSIEKSLVETHHATGTQKETVSETPGSTTDLQLPFKQEERLCEITESKITVPIPEVEALEPTSAFEMISVTDKTIIHVGESENNDLPEMSNNKIASAHPDGATLLEKKSCVEDSMVVTHVSAGIGKNISSESPYSTRDLELSVEEKETSSLHESDKSSQMVQIPEYTTIEAESTSVMAAEADQNSSPDMGTENNKSVEVTKTVPALVLQADANLNEQISSIDDSIVVTKVASGIEEETASETLQPMEDLQLLFEKKEASNSYDIDKSNLAFLIPEAGATEAVSALDTDAKTLKESSSVIETTNDNPLELIDDHLVMTNIKPALVQQAEATLHKQMSSIEESVFETCDAAETEKETVTLNPESTGDLQVSFEHEEGMCEIDKSSIAVPIAEIIPSADPFEMVAVSDKINIPVIESKNNDLLEMTNMETALAKQDGATLFKQTSCVEDSMVDTYISADIGKDDSSEIPESPRDLQLPVEEKEMSSLHESDKSSQKVQIREVEEEDASSSSKLIVPIPEDTKLGAVSTFDIGAEADQGSSLGMETQNNKLVGVTNTVPALVAQAKITRNEQTSDIDDSMVVTKVASGIEEETARETPQSMGDSHLLFEENAASSLYNIDKSDLLVLILEAEATDAKTREESSPVTETTNDDPLELIDDYLVLKNTEAALVQQTEATLQEQMSYIEEPVVETHIAAATEKETVTENPESAGDLQLSLEEEERLCEIDKSYITVPVPEVEASEAAKFEMVAVTDEIIVPVIESKNIDLLEMNTTKTALVQQDGATLFEQMSSVDSMVVTYISAEIGKETTNEIPESTRDLHISIKDKEASSLHESGKSSLLVQISDVEENDALSSHETDKSEPMVLIPEDTTSGAVSTFGIDIGADQNSSPAMETENNKLVGVTNTVPYLVAQAEITLNEQISSVDDSIVVAQVATAIEEETKTETLQSMGDIELSFKEEEATEAVSDFDTVVMTHVKSSPVIETRNDVSVGLPDDLLVLTNTEPALVQKAEATLHEQMLSIEDSLDDKHTTTVAEKETEHEIPESTEDLQLSVEEEEGLCEIDKSNITVAVPEVEATEAAPDFNMLAVPEINIVPRTELENNDILRMTNTETAPVQLDGASLLEQMSHAEDPMVVTHVSAGIGKQTSIGTLKSTQDLKVSFKEKEVPGLHEFDKSILMVQTREVEEKDASSSHKTDKSDTIILIPDATTSGEVLTNMHAEADEESSSVMETENNTLLEMTNTVPTLVVQTESTQNEQTPSVDTPVVPTQVAEGIEKETACETSESTEDLQLSYEEQEASNSYKIEKSNLAVPIPELESTEAISTIDTGVVKDEDSSIVTETRNDDSLGLTDNLLIFSNTVSALVQQAETTESTRYLQISFEDKEASSSRETDKSTLAVAIPDVETSKVISTFDTGAMTDEDTSPVTEIQFNGENLSQTMQCPISAISQSLETSDKVSKPSLDEQLLDPTPDTHEPMQFQTKDKAWTQKNKSSVEVETILAQDSTLPSPILIWKEDITLRNDQEVLQSIQLEDLQRMSKETQNKQQDDITLNENPSVLHDDTAIINDTVQTERKEV